MCVWPKAVPQCLLFVRRLECFGKATFAAISGGE